MVARVTLEIALGKEFDYLVPPEWVDQVQVGSRVKVPFGTRAVMGCVTGLAELSAHVHLRPLLKVVGQTSLITPKVLELARWMADYYCCPVEVALKSVLPEAVRREDAGWRERLVVRALLPSDPAPSLTKRQAEVWHVVEEWRALPLQELLRLTGATADLVRRLEDKGLVEVAPAVSERDPYARDHILPTEPLALNVEQAKALTAIAAAIDASPPSGPAGGAAAARPFLLYGVTGSGKTEVYLQAIARVLERGQGAIVLVPEISLTPQTVERFKARFCHGPWRTLVAVLHSHLSNGERHDEWHKIRQGRARVVIGARSAVFAPVERLGLIVVDEEHEHSYKQEEAPRYHARDLAVLRGQREGAVVVLGSATPSLESYYNARRGKYGLLELSTRVDDQRLPMVRVVDMRREARRGQGPPVFSRLLRDAILARLEKQEQVILFLNRRGYATSLQCPQCGYVAECPDCSLALTFHFARGQLCCHLCGHVVAAPTNCPVASCNSSAVRYAGLGTERVHKALDASFPHARIQRMDSDTLERKEDYRRILGDFRAGKIDILVGTQMIAKGLHFPNVTLVGIVYADLTLHLPDFRAGERTFQLLTQVAGRAGRGEVEGEVIVQAFTPHHAAIQFARRHDYAGFYEQELAFRAELGYPPLKRVALFTLRGRNEDKVAFVAGHLRRELDQRLSGLKDPVVMGPGPAPRLRIQGLYRYQLMVRARQMARIGPVLAELQRTFPLPEDLTLTIDVDPVDLL